MGLPENLWKIIKLMMYVASGSILGVFLTIFFVAMEEKTTLHPADNYGPEDTWYHMVFNDKINFEGSSDILVLSGASQNTCKNIKNYGDVPDGKSVRLYDRFNPDSNLPAGMKVYLYWGKACSDWKPYGVITVPANVTEVRVPRLNHSSPNYEVFNNFEQRDGRERTLNGHVYGLRWFIPND